MAVGLGHGSAGMFHLFTHAWFKALLFLGSGAIIFACHHEQNIWKMGGLIKKMPITSAFFGIGFLALIAVPGTSGFFSKEQILEAAHHQPSHYLFWIAATVALLTAFYMTRLFVVVFLGKTKSDHADHAHEVGPLMYVPLGLLAILALSSGYPLVANLLAPSYTAPEHLFHLGFTTYVSIGAVALGLVSGLILYVNKTKDPLSIPLFQTRFYIDSFYERFIVGCCQNAAAAIVAFIDELLITNILVNGMSRFAVSIGRSMRSIQSGRLQTYSLVFGLGVILIIYITVFFLA